MHRFLRLIIIIVIAIAIFKGSTFGWRFSNRKIMDFPKDNKLTQILKSHVYKLAHEIGDRSIYEYDRLNEAADYIARSFASFGYDVEFQDFMVLNKTVKNIIAIKIGIEKPQEIVIVGAHYDTCFNPGGNDNASGVASLLELARFASTWETKRTVKFIAFVNEEPPFFKTEEMGSRVYAKRAKAKGEDIKATIILETIGYYTDKPYSQRYPPLFGLFYPNKANFIAIVGNFSSRWLVKEVVLSFKNKTKFPVESVTTFGFVPGVDFSDHSSFWKEGYPAVMVTDTAFYRYPHYHGYSDTYDKLNYKDMREVVKGLSAVLIDFTK